MSLVQKIRGAIKYAWVRLRGGPLLVNMEVTHLCNAQCDFCDFWKTKRSGKLTDYDYIDALRRLNPLCVTLTGGEPTINKHLPEVVRNIKSAFGFMYVGMVTHGSLLTLEKAEALWDAGIDQIAVSLNYLGPEHDTERGIPGLYEHLAGLIPRMTARGINVVLNTVIMQDNLGHIVPIARQARAWGAKVSYSCYSDFKNGNDAHLIDSDHLDQVERVVDELLALKPRLGNIVSSAYYLRRIPGYFRDTLPHTCQAAGKWLIQLTPAGEIKPCPELPVVSHYKDFKTAGRPIACSRCWYSCRGETQAALTIERAMEVLDRM
jgi:MoaA/NifB/PqqE/SkfB family radical SAM enzyme